MPESEPSGLSKPALPPPVSSSAVTARVPAPARAEPASHREDIPIPDLKLLRRIGSGSYGEVWLARAITGALRAVKICWREDFEFEKTFRREFEGIQQFEPISRGHQGLVDVLHVGWNEDRGFYYYVMELADDAVSGTDIEVSSYAPRTLSSDFKNHGRLALQFCKEAGIFLADALGYMHSYGLTHRDIKPSNIIFVGGVCKLADIGLVAAHGERTFVGTEGFVPPEGPGTFAADIFSLGKVLYEISSGKDRMEFPEVPDDLQPGEMTFWRDWNNVICKACAPQVQDRYASAADFANALRDVGVPRPVPVWKRLTRSMTALITSSMLAGTALSMAKHEREWKVVIPAPDATKLTAEELARLRLPREGRLWMNSKGSRFIWSSGHHVADKPVTRELFFKFVEGTMRPFEGEIVQWAVKGSKGEDAVVVPSADAMAFCEWLAREDQATGALNEDYEYRWKADPTVKASVGKRPQWSSMRLELSKIHFGEVYVTTTPPDAEVIVEGGSAGHTPLIMPRVRVGEITCEIHRPGFKREILKGKVEEGKTLRFDTKLKPTRAVVFGKKWTNSMGMEFVPLGDVLMASTETRRADWAEFLRNRVDSSTPPVPLDTDRLLPMTHVNRADAEMFCRWLSMVERAKGLLEPHENYRLPTDDEWSMAAVLPRERGDSPADRTDRIEGVWPWGFTWPPLPPAGNFWDGSAATAAKTKDGVPSYNDKFPGLAPVKSFQADPRTSLYDLAGNVWEWVQEDFGGADGKTRLLGVVRGGSWRSKDRAELLASHRKAVPATSRADDIGFRVVLSADGVRARLEREEE